MLPEDATACVDSDLPTQAIDLDGRCGGAEPQLVAAEVMRS